VRGRLDAVHVAEHGQICAIISWYTHVETLDRGIPMNAAIEAAPRRLFRDREGAIANTLVLSWTSLSWLAAFPLMAQPSIALNAIGVLLCTHTMVLAAYLIMRRRTTLCHRSQGESSGWETMSFIAGASYASFERIRHMHIRHHLDRADLACSISSA